MRLENRRWASTPVLLSLALLGGTTIAEATVCRAEVFEVSGSVIDSGGRPVSDADVYILLDRPAKKKTRRAGGIRARATLTDRAGMFSRRIVCGEPPDPCAAKPRHVTIGVDVDGSMTWKIYRFKDLESSASSESCAVHLPPLRMGSVN